MLDRPIFQCVPQQTLMGRKLMGHKLMYHHFNHKPHTSRGRSDISRSIDRDSCTASAHQTRWHSVRSCKARSPPLLPDAQRLSRTHSRERQDTAFDTAWPVIGVFSSASLFILQAWIMRTQKAPQTTTYRSRWRIGQQRSPCRSSPL